MMGTFLLGRHRQTPGCALTLLEGIHNLARMCDLLLYDIRHTRRSLLL